MPIQPSCCAWRPLLYGTALSTAAFLVEPTLAQMVDNCRLDQPIVAYVVPCALADRPEHSTARRPEETRNIVEVSVRTTSR